MVSFEDNTAFGAGCPAQAFACGILLKHRFFPLPLLADNYHFKHYNLNKDIGVTFVTELHCTATSGTTRKSMAAQDEAKRRRNTDEADVHASDPITRADMDGILAEFKSEFGDTIKNQINTAFNSTVSSVLSRYDQRVQSQIHAVREDLNKIDARCGALEKSQIDIKKHLAKVADSLACAEKMVPPPAPRDIARESA